MANGSVRLIIQNLFTFSFSGKRELKKGFRYPIKLTFNNPSSCYLTVKFPNGTILSPVDKTYIYRFTGKLIHSLLK